MKIFKNRCYNGGNKHNFKPRYREESNVEAFKGIKMKGFIDLEELLKNKIYVRDVCIWCGKTIEYKR